MADRCAGCEFLTVPPPEGGAYGCSCPGACVKNAVPAETEIDSDLNQCPCCPATRCLMDEPCLGCETYSTWLREGVCENRGAPVVFAQTPVHGGFPIPGQISGDPGRAPQER